MTGPRRIQRRRTPGWRLPDGAVIVTRYSGDNPGRWGNPFVVGADGVPDRAASVALYEQLVASDQELRARIRRELAGRDLACWCPPDKPCHADVMLRIANVMRRITNDPGEAA